MASLRIISKVSKEEGQGTCGLIQTVESRFCLTIKYEIIARRVGDVGAPETAVVCLHGWGTLG